MISAGSRPTSAQWPRKTSSLWRTVVGPAAHVAHVGVLRDEPQRALLAAPADHDRRAAGLQRLRHVARVVGACRSGPANVGRSSRSSARQICTASSSRSRRSPRTREVEAVARVLDVVPGRADTEDRAAVRDDVERRDHLREQRRVAVRDAGDERAELRPVRCAPRARRAACTPRGSVRRVRRARAAARSGPSPRPMRTRSSSAASACSSVWSNISASGAPAWRKPGI